MDSTRAKFSLAVAVPVGVFLVSLLIRLFGIGWGLPNELHNQSYHPDEPIIALASQNMEPARFDFTPGFYNYGTLYLTVLNVAWTVADGYSGGRDWSSEEKLWLSVGRAHKAGRLVSAFAGAATVLFVYLILRRRVGEFGSLMGAGALALAPGHVVHSRFQTVDVLAAFLVLVSLYFALKLTEDGDKKFVQIAIWSGVFAGLSAGTKYTGVLALASLLVACAMAQDRQKWKAALFGFASAIGAFLVVTPGAILESSKFFKDFAFEMTHTGTGHGLVFAATPSGFLYHWSNMFVAMGPVMIVFGAIGLGRACYRKHAWALALMAFAIVYYVLIGRAEVKFMRYVFPLLPVFAIGFGWIVARAHQSPAPARRFVVMFFAIMGVGGVFGGGAMRTATYTGWMVGPDPRDAAAQYVRTNVQGETTVGLVSDPWFYTPPYFRDVGLPRSIPFDDRNAKRMSAYAPTVLQYVPDDPGQRIGFDLRLLTDLRPDFVSISSFEFEDLSRIKRKLPSPPEEYKTQIERAEEFMDNLSTHYQLQEVRGIDGSGLPHDMRYIRPEVQVWKRKTLSSPEQPGSSITSPPSEGPVGTQ